MTIKLKSVINVEYFKNVILILLITVALYVIFIQNIGKDNELESFNDSSEYIGDDLDYEYSAGIIYKRIKKSISDKLKKSTIVEVTNNTSLNNTFTINQFNIPVGVIRFFPYVLPSRYDSWLLCDGSSRIGQEYPELFRLMNNRDPLDSVEEFSTPNLVGRLIFGKRFNRANSSSPDIDPNGGSGGKFMNPSNSNFFTELDTSDDTGLNVNQLQDLGINSALFKLDQDYSDGIIYDNLGTDGIDGCPPNDIKITTESNQGFITCVDNRGKSSNLPPHIALYPYIKAKTVRYRYNIN